MTLPSFFLGRVISAVLFSAAAATPVSAFATRGEYSYSSARQCSSAAIIPPDRCENAERNAKAEFEEKSPHFPSRDDCTKMFRNCSIGFGGQPIRGKSGVFFVPRQDGFKIRIKSGDEMAVTPVGPGYYRSRTILKADTSIDPRAGRQAREAFEASLRKAAAATSSFGQSEPGAPIGPAMAPVINNDPNFDCASVLEPTAKGDPNTGCYLAPPRR